MLEQARQRTRVFQENLRQHGIELAILSDQASIAYLAGFWGYLSIEFGRPTFLIVKPHGEPTVITPLMEGEMVSAMTWIEDIRHWQDAGEQSWTAVLIKTIGIKPENIWVEMGSLPALVRNFFDEQYVDTKLHNIDPILAEQRMIKSEDEIKIMAKTGQIANAMMAAAEASLAEGVPEYESALAVINAGTRAAAGFLTDKGWEAFVSPMIHNLQILQSGRDTSMVHRRASVKPYAHGDPVYFCFCNMAEFKHYRLGFDRMFFISEISDSQARIQEVAVAAQQAAIATIRPGIRAEEAAHAANAVYHAAGFEAGYRTGRAIGMSYLEAPELKVGDTTILRAGMTFAVDGGISVDCDCGGRIGDSIVVTQTGYEYLTDYPRGLLVV